MTAETTVLIAALAVSTAYTIRLIARPPDVHLYRRIIDLEKQVREFEDCKKTLDGLQSEIVALRGDNLRLLRIALATASAAQQGSFEEAASASATVAGVWQTELDSARQNHARLQAQAGNYGSNVPPALTYEIERTARRVHELESQLDLYHALNEGTPSHANRT